MSATSDSGARNFSFTKAARLSAMRSLLRGITSVWAVMKGMPVGMRRNKAVTANQSAMPPTIAASATARSASSQRFSGSTMVTTKTRAAAASSSEALRLARPNWASLTSTGRLLRDRYPQCRASAAGRGGLPRDFLVLHAQVVGPFHLVQLARIFVGGVEPGLQALVKLLLRRRGQRTQ